MKPENELVLDLVKEVRIHRLGNCDGCMCSNFSVRNVHVDISCGKGRDRGIWIYSASCDYADDHDKLLLPIAEEVKRQVEASDMRGPIPIHFYEWKNERRS